MKRMIALFIFMSFLLTAPALAEYYRYVDNDGVVHFTDNLADVPVEQRIEKNMFQEIKSSPAQGTKPVEDATAETGQKQTREAPKVGQPSENETLSQIQILNREKEILDREYEDLVTKKQALRREKNTLTTAAQFKDYQQKVRALNKAIADFETRRAAFELKAKAFNAKSGQ